jgi:acyl-CoA thioesterase FadM
MRLDINYLSEVKLGETLELWTAPIPVPGTGKSAAVEGRRTGSGQAAFRAELRLNPAV